MPAIKKTCAVLLLAAISFNYPAVAKKTEPATIEKHLVASEMQNAQIEIEQKEIEPSIDIGRVSVDMMGGGVVGLLISVGQQKRKRGKLADIAFQRAEGELVPLRTTLRNFNVNELAMESSKSAFDSIEWVNINSFTESAKSSKESRLAFAVSNDGRQLAFVSYRYQMSPDFTQIQVISEISFAYKKQSRGKISLKFYYRQRILSIVELKERHYKAFKNVAVWNADDGKLAKSALTNAFQNIEKLIPYILELSPAQMEKLDSKKNKKAFAAGYYGSLVEDSSLKNKGSLIWSKGLVFAQPASAD